MQPSCPSHDLLHTPSRSVYIDIHSSLCFKDYTDRLYVPIRAMPPSHNHHQMVYAHVWMLRYLLSELAHDTCSSCVAQSITWESAALANHFFFNDFLTVAARFFLATMSLKRSKSVMSPM